MLTDVELADMRATAAVTYTATVTIAGTSDGGGGWDPVTGPTPAEPAAPLYDGPARVQAVRNSAQPRDAAGQAVTVRPYKVALPWDAPEPAAGARLTVTGHPRDALVVGKVLTVTDVVYGDLGVERVLYADLDLTNQPQGA